MKEIDASCAEIEALIGELIRRDPSRDPAAGARARETEAAPRPPAARRRSAARTPPQAAAPAERRARPRAEAEAGNARPDFEP